MKISIRQKVFFFSLFLISAVGLIGYSAYKSRITFLDSEKWMNHTNQVIYQSTFILSLVKDIETSSRGFIITKDSTFLEPLIKAEKIIFLNAEQLRNLTQDNPAQLKRVDSLIFYLQKRLDLSKQQIEKRNQQVLTTGIALSSIKQGKSYTDYLNNISADIKREETDLLKLRKQSNQQSLSVYNNMALFMFILIMLFTVLLIFATGNYLTQNKARKKREAALNISNNEIAFQNAEKEKRAAEFGIANKELIFQNQEKEKRAAELIIANKELAFQNDEKEKRAAELIIANKELAFQNEEKEKRAAELGIANKELIFQNEEKEKRAAELIIANNELAFQNEEKEKRAAELINANKELLAFTYISSHDLQEPLRKIQTFVTIILENENKNLSDKGKYNFQRMQQSAGRMQQLIDDLLAFSRINTTEHTFEKTDLNLIINEVKSELRDNILEKHATIEASESCPVNIIAFQFRQLMYNLISNALKFSNPDIPSHIIIKSSIIKGTLLNDACIPASIKTGETDKIVPENFSPEKYYCHISVKDNGIGFEPHFSERIFGVFQKLHSKEVYKGTGIGLAIVKKIVDNHKGLITATSELGKGATFDIYIPAD